MGCLGSVQGRVTTALLSPLTTGTDPMCPGRVHTQVKPPRLLWAGAVMVTMIIEVTGTFLWVRPLNTWCRKKKHGGGSEYEPGGQRGQGLS